MFVAASEIPSSSCVKSIGSGHPRLGFIRRGWCSNLFEELVRRRTDPVRSELGSPQRSSIQIYDGILIILF
jgi:hypothetical protein